ncbi:MAG TPA: GTP 3',8-cyclase MoaA [bacterium]|nr:GTP 3',8-cyclase MoaA [bacterium]
MVLRPAMTALTDRLGRPLRNLRLSVTDRCNLRCQYCMPEQEYRWLKKTDILTFEELLRVVDCFTTLGVDKVRLTGGEPLLRRDLPQLVAMLAAHPRLREVAMTTNGVLLREHARALKAAGLSRVTISLDSLDPATFQLLTRRDDLDQVLDGLAAAREAGFTNTRLDTVAIAGVNDGELVDLVEFARTHDAEVRFIEYMDVGGATRWRMDRVIPRARILERLTRHFGEIRPLPRTDSAPAERFAMRDGTTFGIISSVTQPFCSSCDRARLTADGMWFTCLYAEHGTDLRRLLRGGASDQRLRDKLVEVWAARRDRGAELRAGMSERTPLPAHDDPHLQMHTRGG